MKAKTPKPAPELSLASIMQHDSRLFTKSYFVSRARSRGMDEAQAERMFDAALESDNIVYCCQVGMKPGVPAYALRDKQ